MMPTVRSLQNVKTAMSATAPFLAEIETCLSNASIDADWNVPALEPDRRAGNEAWKPTPECVSHDPLDIARRLAEWRDRRTSRDDIGRLFALTEGIHGNMTGMGRKALHEIAKFGTKQVTNADSDEPTVSPEHVAALPETVITAADRLDFAKRASHCVGRSALVQSDVGALVQCPSGVTGTLFEPGFLPTVIAASSGGAVVAGAPGTNSDGELRAFCSAGARGLISGNASDKKPAYPGRPETAAADVQKLLGKVVLDLTVRDAWAKTRRTITITASIAEQHRASRLMNAVTSPHVFVRSAIPASCVVPGVSRPVTLTAKTAHGETHASVPDRKRVDGTGTDNLPANRIADA
jgi:hypothetical protein